MSIEQHESPAQHDPQAPDPRRVAPGRSAPAPVAPGAAPASVPAEPITPQPHGGDAPDDAAHPSTPREVTVQVGRAIGLARSGDEQLALALGLMADRHSRDAELRDVLMLLASWSSAHVRALESFAKRYRIVPSEHPERLRGVILSGTRIGSPGLLLDLQDLMSFAFHVRTSWTVVAQAAKELRDAGLQSLAVDAGEQTDRQIAYLRTRLMTSAPHALTVPVDPMAEVASSIPKRMTIGGIPDLAWAPIVSGGLIALVGIAGVLVGRPWLLPSLGPTAALVAEQPAQPQSRLWNMIVGHAGGIAAGFVGVLLAGAMNAPVVLVDKVLAPERVVASVIAMILTVAIGMLTRASHPPAAATTLLVALGAIKTPVDVANLMAGVLIVALLGEGIRRVRLHGVPPRDIDAPQSLRGRIRLERKPG
ncbi:MAG: HPP family protein [Chloroflexota bacterium]